MSPEAAQKNTTKKSPNFSFLSEHSSLLSQYSINEVAAVW